MPMVNAYKGIGVPSFNRLRILFSSKMDISEEIVAIKQNDISMKILDSLKNLHRLARHIYIDNIKFLSISMAYPPSDLGGSANQAFGPQLIACH
ncbi:MULTISPECIES: hypothetical protein [unclassified Pseudomonas]|uniref:hypothetical protein n=1 Tax=unclassified Pseudomonas TaxID=196821 RepID=UPI00114640C6|nr:MULTISPECIES: hypothetical protein [unclassified Pseudomonas]MCL9800742.1 hypothetical protein [Pseudomonas sp. AKS31]